MDRGVAISGMGIVSAIGMNAKENFEALKKGQHGISEVELVDTILKENILVGEIKKSNQELEQILKLPTPNSFSRSSMLGMIAMKEAFRDAEIQVKDNTSMAFVNSTTVGGMDMVEKFYDSFLTDKKNQHYISVNDAGSNTHLMADYFNIKGFVTTISTACSSAANAIMLGARLIKSGRAKKVVVGGMDGLCKFTLNGFNTLMLQSNGFNKPFDDERVGLNLGEGAAYLILESQSSLQKRDKTPLAYLTGYANANDAYHQTASSEQGEGAFLAMKKAFEVAGIQPEQVDYINAHGTATPNNDLSEGRALLNFFENKVPDFSSTKPFTGHTLAAAASIEAVFSILALRENIIYPNLNFKTKMKEFDLTPQIEIKKKEVNTVLSNSFGFGGNCSSLIFEK